MFTKQKKNYRTFVYTALVITLCLLITALLWPTDDNDENNMANAQTEIQSEDNDKTGKADEDNGAGKSESPSENYDKPKENQNSDISSQKESYYIVRKDGSRVSVYFINEDGKEVKLETTDIFYELLTPEDQKAFAEGIKIDTQENLAALLQDFES